MQDQPAPAVEQSQPAPQEKSATTLKTPEVNNDYEQAAKIGRGVLDTNLEREREHYGFSLHADRIPKQYINAVRSRGKDEVLTETDVRDARRGSVGISLEAARQLKDGDYYKTGRMNDNDDNLVALRTAILDGQTLSKQVVTVDPEGFTQVTKQLVSQQLSVPPEKVEMTEEQLRNWAKGNYDTAKGKLEVMINALREYESASPFR